MKTDARPGTVIGNLAADQDVVVATDGAVTFGGTATTIGWWVGASDRWHIPAEESPAACTQRRIDGMPVVETALRVPGGQVLQRAWCVAEASGDAVVVEVENRSTEPIAVAAIVRTAGRVRYDGERSVAIAGAASLVLGRRPARTVSGDDERLGLQLAAGGGDTSQAFEASAAATAFVFPLAHTARLRWAMPLGAATITIDPERLADHDAVARGWRSHIDAGARIGVPDDRLSTAVVAARSTLLVRSTRARDVLEAAAVATALGAWGHHDAVRPVVEALVEEQRLNGAFGRRNQPEATAAVLTALGLHVRATGDAALAERLVGPVAKAAHRLAKAKGWGPLRGNDVRFAGGPPAWFGAAQADAADVLDLAEQPEAAALCRARLGAPPGAAASATPDQLLVAYATAPPTDDASIAGFLLAARGLLVDDTVPGVIDVLPTYPEAWLGQDVEGHRLPTRAGLLSFAVRWHGARPALLWELQGDRATRLRCRGLDRSWSSDDPVGEALLGPVEPAGGLPKVVAPLGAAGTSAGDAPEDGMSFR